jgi:hypothetical protein
MESTHAFPLANFIFAEYTCTPRAPRYLANSPHDVIHARPGFAEMWAFWGRVESGSEPIAGLYPQTRQFVNVHGYIGMKVGAAKLHLGDNALLGIERNKPAVKRKLPASAFKFS